MIENIMMSTLYKTWLFDLDGTLLKHNGYKLDGGDTILEGVKEYLDNIPQEDRIIILTSRKEEYREITLQFLRDNNIRYDKIIFDIPFGERIVVNDRKPSGIDMAYSFNINRNEFKLPNIIREK